MHAAPPFNRVPTKSVRSPFPHFSIQKHHFPGLFAVFCTAKALFPQWFCCLSPLPPCPPSLSLPLLACTQTFAMTTAVKGTVVNGVFISAHGGSGFAASAPVPIEWLSRGTVVAITLTGKSRCFAVAIASTNALNEVVHHYDNNHHAAFHYSSGYGRVNSDVPDDGSRGTFAVHDVYPGGGPFTAVLTLRGSDRTVSFAVNGVQQSGVWALPTTDAFYLMLATAQDSGNNIAVTDVTVTGTA